MDKAKSPVIPPVISVVLSFVASSHHWLHMTVLLVLGGSANRMAAMQNMIGLRRLMIVISLLLMIFTVYRLIRHRCTRKSVVAFNGLSILVSLGFIAYTLGAFGW